MNFLFWKLVDDKYFSEIVLFHMIARSNEEVIICFCQSRSRTKPQRLTKFGDLINIRIIESLIGVFDKAIFRIIAWWHITGRIYDRLLKDYFQYLLRRVIYVMGPGLHSTNAVQQLARAGVAILTSLWFCRASRTSRYTPVTSPLVGAAIFAGLALLVETTF